MNDPQANNLEQRLKTRWAIICYALLIIIGIVMILIMWQFEIASLPLAYLSIMCLSLGVILPFIVLIWLPYIRFAIKTRNEWFSSLKKK